jgi:AraC-like DNA-binding protein
MFDQNMGALSDVHYRTMCRQCGAEVEHSLKQPSTVSCPNGHVVGPSLQLGQVLSGEDLPALDGQKITRDIVSAFKKAGYPPLVTGDVGTSKWWFDRGYSIKAHEQPVRCKGGHLRHANQVLAEQGTSLTRLVLARRLARCRSAFEDPTQAHRMLSEIAYGWGFCDLTHFGRRFKQAYGILPSEARAGLRKKL